MNYRQLLVRTTLVFVVVGILVVATFFIKSLSPTVATDIKRSMEINLQNVALGEIKRIDWLVPVVVYRPSPEDMAELAGLNANVWGPKIKANDNPVVYVYVPNSTYLGCGLKLISRDQQIEYGWPRGWFDPCHIGGWPSVFICDECTDICIEILDKTLDMKLAECMKTQIDEGKSDFMPKLNSIIRQVKDSYD